ncbi:hypothetical protein KGF54_003907 [Candida jiufengensis]|uniref:uncharacterized protein n=1 Tax=Candida jiufengensis TaxID=497108 RepID=UPI0022254D53|nr:uncharacterized protein KGF54_003907 [Candida jiufengensis]KAI5950833.1 hypothetical protein KGF54_003907 [Candida jiufengensis]
MIQVITSFIETFKLNEKKELLQFLIPMVILVAIVGELSKCIHSMPCFSTNFKDSNNSIINNPLIELDGNITDIEANPKILKTSDNENSISPDEPHIKNQWLIWLSMYAIDAILESLIKISWVLLIVGFLKVKE